MSKRTTTYDSYDYQNYRERIDYHVNLGTILPQHLTWFTKGAEIDNKVLHHLRKQLCIVLLSSVSDFKLVGVVACNDEKNFAGINNGSVVEVLYDREDRDYKKHLNKVKAFFKGITGSNSYVGNFIEYRNR